MRPPRIDALERVTGKATYTGDVHLPGMLYARVLRSPHPHARIRSIDVSKAPGAAGRQGRFSRTKTARSSGAPDRSRAEFSTTMTIKKITKQRRYAFNNPVRFVGEPVAAVAAIDRHVAEEALHLIEVDYEVLPFVLDPEEALKPGASQIWPEGNLSLNPRNEAQPDRAEARQRRGRLPRVRPRLRRSLLPPPSSTTRRWSRASASRTGKATS